MRIFRIFFGFFWEIYVNYRATSPADFILKHRAALESDYVSDVCKKINIILLLFYFKSNFLIFITFFVIIVIIIIIIYFLIE